MGYSFFGCRPYRRCARIRGIAGTAVGLAKLVFMVAIVLFVASLIYALITGRRPPPVG